MAKKITVETIGELRKALASVPDDITFQCLFDGCDYRKLEIQRCYEGQDGEFIKIELTEE